MVEPHCWYCEFAEGKCPPCVERSAFVPTAEANEPRLHYKLVEVEE